MSDLQKENKSLLKTIEELNQTIQLPQEELSFTREQLQLALHHRFGKKKKV